MIFDGNAASNLLTNWSGEAVTAGKQLLGERWEKFGTQERSDFIDLMRLMARARVAELAGLPGAKSLVETLEVALGEWKLAGKTEVLIVAKSVATTVLGLAATAAASALKKAILL